MNKILKKTIVIPLIIFVVFVIAIFVFEYMISHNKFTGYIENKINNELIDVGRVEIGGLFFDLFSGLLMKDVSFHGNKSVGNINLKCESLGVKFKLTELLHKHIRAIEIKKPELNLNLEELLTLFEGSEGGEFDIREIFPEDVYIGSFAFTKVKLEVVAYDYLINTSDLNLSLNEIQLDKPIKLSIDGKVLTRNLSNKNSAALPAEFGVKCGYSMLNDEVTIMDGSSLSINGVGKFDLKGVVSYVISDPKMDVVIKTGEVLLHNLPDLLKDFNFIDLSPMALTGECETVIMGKGGMEQLKLNVDTFIKKLNVTYEDIVYKADEFQIPLNITVYPLDKDVRTTGNSEFSMPVCGVWLSGNEYVTFQPFPVKFVLDYPYSMAINCNSVDGDLLVTEPPLSFKEFVSNIRMEFQTNYANKLPFNGIVESLVSDTVVFNAVYDYDDAVLKKTMMSVGNVDLSLFLDKIKFLMPDGLKDWSYEGKMGVDLFLDAPNPTKPEEIEMITNVNFSDVKFSSPEYDYFGENINGFVDISLLTDYSFKGFSTKVNGGMEPFLVGLGQFSTDMRERKMLFSVESFYDVGKDSVSDIKASMECDGVGEFALNGGAEGVSGEPQFDINLEMKGADNSNFFDTFVKDSVEYSLPELYGAEVGGVSKAEVSVKGSFAAMQVDGVFGLNETRLKFGDTVIEGLYMDFPFSVKYPSVKKDVDDTEYSIANYGTMRMDKLSYDFIDISDFEFRPALVNNRFFVDELISIPIFGGTIEIPHIFVADVINPTKNVGFSLQLNEIDLKELSAANGLTPFEGDINTSLISFKQEGERLSSEGEMRFSLFGGDIIVDNLVLNDFMTSLMGIEFSADVNNMDLSEMSKTFQEWGNVSGIINGSINNFKIVAGEPSSFNVELLTEKKKKVKQFVSAAFLKSFVPGVANALDTFGFTSYKYEVIGLRAKLENDYIEFDGAVEEDGKEYFMKGAGLKKLNIVFSKKDRRMKFSRFMGSFESMMASDFDETQVKLK